MPQNSPNKKRDAGSCRYLLINEGAKNIFKPRSCERK